jgi:hypothetical protein
MLFAASLPSRIAHTMSDAPRRASPAAPDDRRFLMIRRFVPNAPDKLIVVENWFEEIKTKSRK